MTYRKDTKLEVKYYNFLYNQGGLGDMIANTPAIKYVLDHHPHVFPLVFCHDYAVPLLKKTFKQYKNIEIRGMSFAEKYFNEKLPCRSPYLHKISNLSINMVDHGFATVAHTSVEAKYKNYPKLEPIDISKFKLPEKYVVITTGFTSKTREWKPQSVWETSEWCRERGYTPVYLGSTNVKANETEAIKGEFKANYSNGINLINKTNLFEAHSIMAQAKCVLGLDNGLLHLAGMSDVPIITGFTTVLPEHRLPYRNNIIGWNCYVVMPTKEELKCIGCQSRMNFMKTTHDFRNCYYEDYKCLDLMSSDKWIKHLTTICI